MSDNPITPQQVRALIAAATFLDVAAGEGIGVVINKRDGSSIELSADAIVEAVAEVFGLELSDDAKLPFRNAVREALLPAPGESA